MLLGSSTTVETPSKLYDTRNNRRKFMLFLISLSLWIWSLMKMFHSWGTSFSKPCYFVRQTSNSFFKLQRVWRRIFTVLLATFYVIENIYKKKSTMLVILSWWLWCTNCKSFLMHWAFHSVSFTNNYSIGIRSGKRDLLQ